MGLVWSHYSGVVVKPKVQAENLFCGHDRTSSIRDRRDWPAVISEPHTPTILTLDFCAVDYKQPQAVMVPLDSIETLSKLHPGSHQPLVV